MPNPTSSPVQDPFRRVALETTLLTHGVPREAALPLHREICEIVTRSGGSPTLIGVIDGEPAVDLDEQQLAQLLDAKPMRKLNTSNLGAAMALGWSGSTTVAATIELAAGAGVRVMATGGLGGVHLGFGDRPDVSADLLALTRFPVAVVCSGVKSLLDVAATREVLETHGTPVIGFRTDEFPAFYLRRTEPPLPVDARFDDVDALGRFVGGEVARTRRGVVVANPIPPEDEIDAGALDEWLDSTRDEARSRGITGRDVTPFVLGRLHDLSGGATLRANIALVRANAQLAGRIAGAIGKGRDDG